jgi:YHS domain-containing protein
LSLSENPAEKPAPAAAPVARPKNDDLGLKDEDDDEDDDDDEMLTLPVEGAAQPPQKAAEPAAPRPSSEKPNFERPNTEKPAGESEKPSTPGLMKGFRGFCPVVLKDDRKLIEARSHIRSEYRGKLYTFSTLDAKESFDENPRKYIPAGEGNDVVKLTVGETGIEGTLEHAAWYRGRLYLFSSPETRREFVETPSKFVVND